MEKFKSIMKRIDVITLPPALETRRISDREQVCVLLNNFRNNSIFVVQAQNRQQIALRSIETALPNGTTLETVIADMQSAVRDGKWSAITQRNLAANPPPTDKRFRAWSRWTRSRSWT